jgi:hypothetical protein
MITIKDYGEQVDQNPANARADLEARYGRVWTIDEMRQEFDVMGFAAPCVVVTRKLDGVRGSLEFTHNPRFYHTFVEV